jgi:hypothetical protein
MTMTMTEAIEWLVSRADDDDIEAEDALEAFRALYGTDPAPDDDVISLCYADPGVTASMGPQS